VRWRGSRSVGAVRIVAAGLLGVAVAAGIALWAAHDGQPAALSILLIPVVVMALVSTPGATAIIALASLLVACAIYAVEAPQPADAPLRLGALFVLAVLVTALSDVRRRREDRIREQEAELAAARQREIAERLLVPMLERLPELAGARDIPEVALRACRIARDVFGAETASYWQLEDDLCVLLVREPPGDPSPPIVAIPAATMANRKVRLRTVSPAVDRVLNLTGIRRYFPDE
jgi:Peptidase M50B-like